MALIDIGALKNSVAKKINEESFKKAEDALIRQMRNVEAAKQVLRSEEMKLADLERQIEEGTL